MPRRKSPGGVAVTAKQVGYCLKNLHDGTALRRSPLIELPVVVTVANETLPGQYWVAPSALRDVLTEACARLEAGVDGNEPEATAGQLSEALLHETDVREIARQLGVHRSTIYRYVMEPAFDLLAEEIESQQHATHATQIA